MSLAAWAPVFASFEVEMGSEVYHLIYPDWRSVQASAVEEICRPPGNDVWVAVNDDRPVGFVAVSFIDEGASRAGEIYMAAGVGASLIQQAITEIKAQGVDLAVIATGGDLGHAPARALYEKLNFDAFRQVRYYRQL